jgi:hypothetical protein
MDLSPTATEPKAYGGIGRLAYAGFALPLYALATGMLLLIPSLDQNLAASLGLAVGIPALIAAYWVMKLRLINTGEGRAWAHRLWFAFNAMPLADC